MQPRRVAVPSAIPAVAAAGSAPLDHSAHDSADHLRWRAAVSGTGAGLLSGLLGVGGGILLVPAFSSWLHLDIKRAVATSLACVGVLAIPGTITHAALGHIDWGFAVPLSIGVIPGARLGAGLAIRATDRSLRITVGVVLGAIALLYGALEVAALF